MLMIKKGKTKTQVFQIVTCEDCGSEYIYIPEAMKTKVQDKFIGDNIYSCDPMCYNCGGGKLKHQSYYNEEYQDILDKAQILVTDKEENKPRKMNHNDMFIFI